MIDSSASDIETAVAALGDGPLEAAGLHEHVRPLFSRALAREDVYLANHSLGRPLDRTAQDVGAAIDAWYRDLGDAWGPWLADRDRFRALTATLIGAPSADCVVPKTSAGQGLRAVLNSLDAPVRVLTTEGEFDSIDFILRVYRDRGRISLETVRADAKGRFSAAEIATHVTHGVDLVVVSHAMFRTGQILGIAPIVHRARQVGALVLIDVYHSAGVIPLDVAALDVDFAVGGSYKYLRGGPGACWLYVHPRHHTRASLDTGWFAKKDTFSYARPDPPQFATGGDAWLESTPPIATAAQAMAGLEFTLAIGVARLRAHNLAQKKRLADLLAAEGIALDGVDDGAGAFVSLIDEQAVSLAEQLAALGVVADARGTRLRLCPDILTTDDELALAARRLAEMKRGQTPVDKS